MRAAYKPFLLGILITSLLWGTVLYFFIPVDTHRALDGVEAREPQHKHTPQQKQELSNFLDESKSFSNVAKISGSYIKSKHNNNIEHDIIEDLGLIRSEEDKRIREEGYRKHAFNVLVSSRLDHHRAIPDSRHDV